MKGFDDIIRRGKARFEAEIKQQKRQTLGHSVCADQSVEARESGIDQITDEDSG